MSAIFLESEGDNRAPPSLVAIKVTSCLLVLLCAFHVLCGNRQDEQLSVDLFTRRLEDENWIENNSSIPRIIWFMHEENVRKGSNREEDVVGNVLHTITKYRGAWDDPDAPVNFLRGNDCYGNIAEAEPYLVPFYKAENVLQRKNDLCKLATLYVRGGFFFNKEIQVESIYMPNQGIQFVGSLACNGKCIHEGFIASSPKHALLKKSLQSMVQSYREQNKKPSVTMYRPLPLVMGTAYKALSKTEKRTVHLLQMLELDFNENYGHENALYPSVQRQSGRGRCNVVLTDRQTEENYFFLYYLGSSQCKRGPIPRVLWFTYRENVLETKSPTNIYENVMETIGKYRTFWGDTKAPVHFLNDDDCAERIQEVIPELLPHFHDENGLAYKGDMCRNAAILKHGGYYIDVDMDVLTPILPKVSTTFIIPRSCGQVGRGACFLNAFFACTPNHPIILSSLEKMLKIYQTTGDSYMLGPITMFKAWDELPQTEYEGEVEILHETQLDVAEKPELYPDIPRQPAVFHCNWVVHHPEKKIVYAFSRFVGYAACHEA